MLEYLQDIRETPLTAVTGGRLAAALGAAGVVFLVELASSQGWVPILDSLNLVFHESGHPIFGMLGSETLGFLGGTLMQLLVPLLVLGSCWTKRQTIGIGLSGVWFFQNFLNIARYMADARAQVLPLVGGGEHDWATLFGQWGVLSSDTAIAGVIRALGWIGMIGCCTWLAWRWFQRRGVRPEST